MSYIVFARRSEEDPCSGSDREVWAVDSFETLQGALRHYIDLVEDGWDRIILGQQIPVHLTLEATSFSEEVRVSLKDRSDP